MATKKNRSKKKFHKLNGGGNNELTRSMRDHPTYKKPELKLV
jgi:hypothetical protein